MKVVPDTVGPVRDSVNRVSSLDSCVSTISSETSDSITNGPNSITQFTVTEEVTSLTGLGGLLVTDTVAVEGTEGRREDHHFTALLSLESY